MQAEQLKRYFCFDHYVSVNKTVVLPVKICRQFMNVMSTIMAVTMPIMTPMLPMNAANHDRDSADHDSDTVMSIMIVMLIITVMLHDCNVSNHVM